LTRASYSCIKNSLTVCCLMPFSMAQDKSPILNQTQCKPLHKPSLTAWQTEAKGTMNKLGQIPLQVHTAWARYLRGGITFWISYVDLIWTTFIWHLKNTSSCPRYFWNCQSILPKLSPQTPVY
jgi:hypothetical protein